MKRHRLEELNYFHKVYFSNKIMLLAMLCHIHVYTMFGHCHIVLFQLLLGCAIFFELIKVDSRNSMSRSGCGHLPDCCPLFLWHLKLQNVCIIFSAVILSSLKTLILVFKCPCIKNYFTKKEDPVIKCDNTNTPHRPWKIASSYLYPLSSRGVIQFSWTM